MDICKAHWVSEGNSLRLSMPIAKVDRERRMVSGFATLDNIDRQGDIVPSEASIKAFEKFRGNIREMHDDKKAVGKLVSFKEDSFYDQETGKFYKGVFVSAYVSKGAQDTWEKVLDGTLTGFSIGGSVNDYEDSYDENLDKSIRVIKDYDLFELSLVDNQYANVISIEKGHTGGYLSKALIENVFWCSEDDIVQLSANGSSDCPRCDKGMNNIGFVETNDAQKAEVVKSILSTVKNDAKEVSKMDNEVTETASTEEAAETVVEETVEKAVDTQTAEEVEKSVDAEVVEASVEKADDSMDEEDMEDDSEEDDMAMKSVEAEVVKANEEEVDTTKAIVSEMQSTFNMLADTIKSLNEKVEELNKTVSGVKQEVDSVKNEFGKRVDAVEKDTAFRKSGDLGEVVQEPIQKAQVQKSLWGGRFLSKSDLFA
jgi:hypothetical protein